MKGGVEPSIAELHETACRQGEGSYRDPTSGYTVFTAYGLTQRGQCCATGCRHCPYSHDAIPLADRPARIKQAAWLREADGDLSLPVTVLFWSGGKDSYLAHRSLTRRNTTRVVWLTTFDARTGWIAHQDIHIDSIVEQASALNTSLIGVPLHPGVEHVDQLYRAITLPQRVDSLAFGDLHLAHIRKWREETFAPPGLSKAPTLEFPLWSLHYDDLLAELESSGARCTISAVDHADLAGVSPGDTLNRTFVRSLPAHIDPFGENGEFHTRVHVP